MLQLTRVYRGNSIFRGNASLNGQLSHVLKEHNVTQVLPLEPPDAWARRQNLTTAYLKIFRQLVQLFNKERPTDCEWYPGDRGGPPGKGSLSRAARARGWLSRDRWAKGWGHGHVQNHSVGKGSRSVEPGISYPGNGMMLSLLLLLRKRAGGCSLWGGGV